MINYPRVHICLSASPVLDVQHPAESCTHTMSDMDNTRYRLLSLTTPAARNNQDDSLGHHDDNSHIQTVSMTEVSELPSPSPPLTNFHKFGDLPTELRIKIWHLSFLSRVVELHSAWATYNAVVHDESQQQQWQSGCNNPAALSVCLEAREMALEHFRIAFPLASITNQRETEIDTYTTILDEKASLRQRVLYISPEHDTVALLDNDFIKLSKLLNWFRDADRKGLGINSLALSTSGQAYDESVTTDFDRRILRDLDHLTLFTYSESLPPPEWSARGTSLDEQSLASFRKRGNRCELVPCKGVNAWYIHKLWRRGKGRQFWDHQRKNLQVGKNEMRIQDLTFSEGW